MQSGGAPEGGLDGERDAADAEARLSPLVRLRVLGENGQAVGDGDEG